MNPDFPRLLVATEFSPNASGGGPAVVRQMLKGWPEENLFWWSCVPDRAGSFGQKVSALAMHPIPPRWYPNRRLRYLKLQLMKRLWIPQAARHFQLTLNNVKPAVVWVIPHCWSIPPIVRVLPASKYGFHVSVHDYADVQSNVDRFGLAYCQRLSAMADTLYAKATTRDAICQPMLDDLRARTGRDGDISRAGLETADLDYLRHKTDAGTGPIKIAYAGTILVEDTFARFVTALGRARYSTGKNFTLEFFGAHSYRSREWFDPSWMVERGNLAQADLIQALRQCSWGFSPMSLSDDDPRYNQFSLPTKFSSYLAAGLPVITIGHPQSSVMKLAAQYEVGPSLTATGVEEIATLLEPVLGIASPWDRYKANIIRCVETEFDADKMRNALHASLRKCALVNPANVQG